MIFKSVEEHRGIGMVGTDATGVAYSLGRAPQSGTGSTDRTDERIALTRAGAVIAFVGISDALKPDAAAVISELKALGLTPVMVSGDSAAKCRSVAQKVGISEVYAEQSPEQKVAIVEQIQQRSAAAFVGDGINDAPSLARASVGIAMSNGTHLAIESSDVVVLQGSLARVVEAVLLARASLRTIKQNLFWAFSYNVLAIPVAGLGLLNPIIAAFAMGFSDVMTIGNSLRLRRRILRPSSRHSLPTP
jgi:Cu+-exporting ATPase